MYLVNVNGRSIGSNNFLKILSKFVMLWLIKFTCYNISLQLIFSTILMKFAHNLQGMLSDTKVWIACHKLLIFIQSSTLKVSSNKLLSKRNIFFHSTVSFRETYVKKNYTGESHEVFFTSIRFFSYTNPCLVRSLNRHSKCRVALLK